MDPLNDSKRLLRFFTANPRTRIPLSVGEECQMLSHNEMALIIFFMLALPQRVLSHAEMEVAVDFVLESAS